MDLKRANIGLAVAITLMMIGFALVGFDPSDTELQIVCWSATVTGSAVTFYLFWRDVRRRTKPPSRR